MKNKKKFEQSESSGKIITLTTKNEIKIVDFKTGNLAILNAQVDGLIEIIPMQSDILSKFGIAMIGNDEAMIITSELNYGASTLYYLKKMGLVAGDVVFMGDNGEDLTPLTTYQYKYLLDVLPEIISNGIRLQTIVEMAEN